MKKFLIFTVILLFAAAISFAAWSTAGYLLSTKDHSKVQIPPPVISPQQGVCTGQILSVSTSFSLPRYRKIISCTMTPGKGSVSSQSPNVRKKKSFWKYNEWHIEAKLCALVPGKTEKGTLRIELSPSEKEAAPEIMTLSIPSFEVGELPAVASPRIELAEAVPPAPEPSPLLHLLWLLLLLPLLLFFFKKRLAKEVKVTLRQRTLDSLEQLRSAVLSRKLSAREGIAGVSDQLRLYLEERYRLPDSGMTTPEFLEDVRHNAALPERANHFLSGFLNSADMIKFAQAPCDPTAVSTAVDSAVELVENTAPAETEEKNV